MRQPEVDLPAGLAETLVALANQLTYARDPWWVIGSAAAVLHGLAGIAVGDVDVVLGAHDARRIVSDLGLEGVDDGGTDIFRSEVFARWDGPPLKVEFLGGLRVRGDPIEIAAREPVLVGGATVYVPSLDELVRILRLFARPKDIARADALAAQV